jgi:hypothetical protein
MDPRLPPSPLAMVDFVAACPPKLLSEGWKDEENLFFVIIKKKE